MNTLQSMDNSTAWGQKKYCHNNPRHALFPQSSHPLSIPWACFLLQPLTTGRHRWSCEHHMVQHWDTPLSAAHRPASANIQRDEWENSNMQYCIANTIVRMYVHCISKVHSTHAPDHHSSILTATKYSSWLELTVSCFLKNQPE